MVAAMRAKVIIPVVVVLVAVGAGVTWAFWPEPPPADPPAEPSDTGMTDHQTEELMRTIGYVQ